MGCEREPSSGCDRAEKPEREDRAGRSPSRAEAGSKAAVEEDHEESDRPDLLQRDDRELAGRGDAE